MHDDLGERCLGERRAERRDEVMRQLSGEPNGVRNGDAVTDLRVPSARIERREETVLG